jgi:hypothetical protein
MCGIPDGTGTGIIGPPTGWKRSRSEKREGARDGERYRRRDSGVGLRYSDGRRCGSITAIDCGTGWTPKGIPGANGGPPIRVGGGTVPITGG